VRVFWLSFLFVVCCLDYFTWLVVLVSSCFALVLVWHSLLSPLYLNSYCSLLNSVVPLAWWCCPTMLFLLLDIIIPYSMLLFLAWRCCSFCSTLLLLCSFIVDMVHSSTSLLCSWCCCFILLIQHCSSLINNVVFLHIHPQHSLLRYLFVTLMMLLFFV